MINYRIITTHDPEYEQEKKLRNRILRLPLGLALSEQDVRGEENQLHLVVLDGRGTLIGCVLVAFFEKTARIRQMAIEEPYQGRGIGTELMKRLEQALRERNVFKATLHARMTARGFYEKLGYSAVSGTFTEVTIPHVAMEKVLTLS